MEVIEIKKSAAAALLGLGGRLDATTAAVVEASLAAAVAAGAENLAIDMSALDYISSAGLRVFLKGAKLLKGVEGKVVLFGLQEVVKEVFEISGFSAIFPIYDTREQALAVIPGLAD